MSERPLPHVDDESRPYWEAAREHRLSIQRCGACGKHVFYPRAVCPHCHVGPLEWVDASGRGTVYSYTVARRPAGPGFADRVPYVIAIVELEEGVRMLGNVLVDDVDSVDVGQHVHVVFEDVGEITLPMWEPGE